ncbi:ATP-binding protein [Bradyrhizobium sp.]|uniref:sensor histidine kinase n=1 Tax=Bradyrhizobium sp. TaxID=376 RepID=UPI003C1EA23C
MTSPLRILLLEDNSHDAELILELLEADHIVCEITRAQTRAEFVAGLHDGRIDLILADYKLPSFDGLTALRLALDARADLPFIFVSGSLGEEIAIEALKIGATDYVVKSRLSRLVPSVRRALREAHGRTERKKAEAAFSRSEMYLAEAQRLSRTGSFGWDPASGKIYWSSETFRIFECEPTVEPTIELVLERTQTDDRMRLRQIIERASIERSGFTAEHRLLMADGSVKYVRAVANPSSGEDPESFVFVGAIMDVTERKRAEQERERLRQLEADLAHISRVSMMGELAIALAHEIKQPISAASTNAQTCSRWLRRDPPDLPQAMEAAAAMVEDVRRTAGIIDRVSSLYRRGTPERESVDLNEIVREMTVLLVEKAKRNAVSIGADLDPELPATTADRVQLQQVLMNLMLNGVEAMQETGGRLTVASKTTADGQLLISVSDTGIGLSPDETERIFDAFFTTKPQGTGMGLCISRRIVDSHGGHLWASLNPERGTTFQFTLPVEATSSSFVAAERARDRR